MYGDYYDKQLPMFGNKGIGCKNCKFSMHGRELERTWSEMVATAEKGADEITVIHDVTADWKVGDRIAIASSSIDHMES